MTLTELIAKYNGKHVEITGSTNALNQCVDLANAYIKEVLGLKIIGNANAQDFPKHIDSNYDYITYKQGLVPLHGDLIIWDLRNNIGHIAIFVNGNQKTFNSFDQNWPLKSVCHMQVHRSYVGVIGFIRPKINQTNQDDMTTEQLEIFNKLQKYVFHYHEDNLSLINNSLIPSIFDSIDDLNKAVKKGDKEMLEKANDRIKKLRHRMELALNGKLPNLPQ